MLPSMTESHLRVDVCDPPDLTGVLQLVRIAATSSSSVVYQCLHEEGTEVAVKAIALPPGLEPAGKEKFERKFKRELEIWKKLKHPHIVPLLGTANDHGFGSNYPCIVSMWMTHGTLFEYVKQFEQNGTNILLSDQAQIIKGSVAGLEYLHSQSILHGDLHPANILIDSNHNPCLTDFGLSQTLRPEKDQLSYLYHSMVSPGAVLWAAPELLHPRLYPNLRFRATLQSDIYSLGSIILFILSGRYPWQDRGEAENKLKEFQNPPRPAWPVNMPDVIWNFIERCWSPKDPGNRPSAQEVLSFSTDRLEQSLRPCPASEINIVLFGTLRSAKSSIINLLAEKEIAQISTGVEPSTERPRWYQISIGEVHFRLWDTTGFVLADEGPVTHLLPYEHAYATLRNISEGVNVILLCAHKGTITPSLHRLYWFINHFFDGGRAPIAMVVTHSDTPNEGWRERSTHEIAQLTGIPVQSIPHLFVTTDPTGRDQSKHELKEFLKTYATAAGPILLRRDLSSCATTSSDLTTQCGLSQSGATSLVEKFRRPLRPFNVVFFGKTKGSIINLITGSPVTEADSGAMITLVRSTRISTGMQQFRIWDPMCSSDGPNDRNSYIGGLENVCQLICGLSGGSGIDLLVFCKRHGGLTAEELNGYRLMEETLCRGQFPVAIIVTHIESTYPLEKWWEMNGKDLVKSMGGNVIGHSCISSLTSCDLPNIEFDKLLVESRLSIEAMLEDCVRPRKTRISRMKARANLLQRVITMKCTARQKKMTVKNLTGHYRFTGEEAERLMQSYNGYAVK